MIVMTVVYGELAVRMNRDLNVFDGNGIALPNRLHDVELKRRQNQ
jgi:hypothetical protein